MNKKNEILDLKKDIAEIKATTSNQKEIEDIKKDITDLKNAVEKLVIKDDIIIERTVDLSDIYYPEIIFFAKYVYGGGVFKVEVCRLYTRTVTPIVIEIVLNKEDFAILRRKEILFNENGKQERNYYLYLSKQYHNVRNIDKSELEYLCEKYKLDILEEGKNEN